MKKKLLTSLFVVAGLFLTIGIVVLIQKNLLSLPLKFDSIQVNFGNLGWDEEIKHVFRFTNVSRQPVKIVKVKKSCSCTEVKISSFYIRPREYAFLIVKFDPAGLVGKVTRYVWIWLEGYKRPITLRLEARVEPPLILIPPEVDFGRVKPGEFLSKTVLMRNKSRILIKITHVKKSADYINVLLLSKEISPKQTLAILRVSLKNPPIGGVYEHICIKTSLKKMSEIKVPVKAKVLCKWFVSDEKFFFGFVNKEENPVRTIVIRGLRIENVKRVWSNSPKASIYTFPGERQNEIKIRVKLNLKSASEGPLNGDVFVETRDKKQPLLRFPLVGIVQNPNHHEPCCQ